MQAKRRVFKFGGSSLMDVKGIQNVAEIIQTHGGGPLVVVVSAIGKTTNALEEVVEVHSNGNLEAARERMLRVKREYFEKTATLFPEGHEVFDLLNDVFVEVDWLLEEPAQDSYDYLYDQIVSIGEMASSVLVSAYLSHLGLSIQWLDARDLIITDDHFREGWVLWPETTERVNRILPPLLDEGKIVLTQGFIGSTTENATTTLGREGSDYSAAILSFCLDAESMTIWKDVPGVLTADPRLFDNTVKLDRLSYREAIEMTYYGAKVIHPKTIKPLQNKSIPLFVKSFLEPEGSGTMISDDVEDHYPPMVAVEKEQALLYIATRDFSFVAEHHMSKIFRMIADLRLQVNMMQNTAISFAVCVNDFADRVDELVEKLEEEFKVTVERNLELITVRHFQENMLHDLKKGKVVLLEERIRQTVQIVLKAVPPLQRKEG